MYFSFHQEFILFYGGSVGERGQIWKQKATREKKET